MLSDKQKELITTRNAALQKAIRAPIDRSGHVYWFDFHISVAVKANNALKKLETK